MLEKRPHISVSADKMQFCFMSERGIIDAIFILRRMQEESHAKGKILCMCLVDLQEAFNRVPRKVLEWTMRKKEKTKLLVRSVESV